MCRKRFLRCLPLAIAINVVLNPNVTMAQVQNPDTPKDTSVEKITVSGSYTISEVIDTATGLGLTLRETPQSVSVMTAQRIQDQGLDTMADAALNAVGISVKEIDEVRNTFQARGFEINNYQIDGVPLAWSLAGDSGETITDVSIYERIEFVRGATGLMTGAGDPSASVNLVRKHADSAEFKGQVTAGMGSWNNKNIMTDVGTGLNDSGTMRARIVAKYADGESYLDLFENQKTVLYGTLEADISDNTLLRVGASYQNNDPTAPTWGALTTWYDDGSRTNWDRSKTTAAQWTRWETTNKNYFANLVHTFSNGWQFVGNFNQLEYTQDTKLLYLSGNSNKESGEGLFSYPYKSEGVSKQNSVDVQLRGDYTLWAQQHDFVVGALHSKQSADTNTFASPVFPSPGNFNEWDGSFSEPDWSTESAVAVALDTQQDGLYAATRLVITDAFKVIAGGRVSSWEREGVSYGAEMDFGDSGAFIPYFGALYDLTTSDRLYMSYTEIYQPQEARDRNGNFLDPLLGKSTEIGLKSSFLNDMLHTSVAYFVIEQDNLAQTDSGHFIPGTIFEASIAADGTQSKGFEIEVLGQPLEYWNVSLGYSQFTAEDANGNDVNTDHPRKQLKLFSTYEFDHMLQGLTVGLGVNWQSSSYSDTTNPVTGELGLLEQKAYSLVSFMSRYDITEQLSVQFNADNLFDKKYYSQVGFFNQYRYGTPRQLSLGMTYHF